MSTGIAVCSLCRREVHQNSLPLGQPRIGPAGWFHCEDGSPLCPGATSVYPGSKEAIAGRWCGIDEAATDWEIQKATARRRGFLGQRRGK